MGIRKYHNKAFLSYRHVEKDEKLADLLQKKLEHYRIPGKSAEKGASGGGVGRIFRDTTDLGAKADLTAELRRELEDSEYMIVLCSAAAVESEWISREIRYFLQFHDSDRILPVLADGEPEEILPAVFDGIEGMPQHPVACDFRGNRRQAVRRELPRLAEALLDCPYDELVDRRRRYETARLAAAAAGSVLLLSAVAAYYAITSAQIRKSYRERQIGESESLAVQSETALSRRLRLDAIRYALDALPEKEGDRPVVEQAVLALQKATNAYVPEGSRMLAQTGEFTAPGPVHGFSAREIDGTTYLSAVCEKAGKKQTVLWNADTGELVYGREGKPESAGQEEDSAPETAVNAEKDPAVSTDVSTVREQEMYLAQDMLLQSEEGEFWVDSASFELRGEAAKLRGIDVRTGDLLWEADEENTEGLVLFDAKDGVAAMSAKVWYPTDLGTQAREDKEITVESGAVLGDSYEELQLRSTRDGSLICRRRFGPDPDETRQKELLTVLAGGRQEPTLFVELTIETGSLEERMKEWVNELKPVEGEDSDPADSIPEEAAEDMAEAKIPEDYGYVENVESLYALDPETGEERLLLRRPGNGVFHALRKTADGNVLAAICDVPLSRNQSVQGADGPFFQDEAQFYYTGKGNEGFSLCSISMQTGKVLWEERSSCTQHLNVRILEDLQIEGIRACVLSAGTHAQVYEQDTGESLYSFDFPALPVCIRKGNLQGFETLEAVLEDGSLAWYGFRDGNIYRKNAVFPGEILTAQEEGGRYFFLCRTDEDKTINDRIYVFGENAFDTEAIRVVDSENRQICGDLPDIHGSGPRIYGNLILQFTADRQFLLRGMDGIIRGVDADTGKVRWEASPGKNIECAGFSENCGVMVYFDHVLDGASAAMRAAEGKPAPEETWKILHLEDGRVETVMNLAKNVFGDNLKNILYYSIGGDDLVFSALCRNNEKEREEEGWLLRYSLSDGKTETICLSDEVNDPSGGKGKAFISFISQSPDGNTSFVHCICDNEANKNILVDWKTGRITELMDSPEFDGVSAAVWSDDGSRIGLLGSGNRAALYSKDGTMLQIPPDTGKPCGIGFWEDSLVLLDVTGLEIHFRVPDQGIDVLLPPGKQEQYYRFYAAANNKIPVWSLADRKVLLQYESEAFVFDPMTGAVEAVIENVASYNPGSDTMLLFDDEQMLYFTRRYSWEDLAEKGRGVLQGCP